MRTVLAIAAVAALAMVQPARADLTQAVLDRVGSALQPGARAPLDARFVEGDGRPRTLGDAMAGRPTALIFADYTCTYLCGPAMVLAAHALSESGLHPGDYSFVVIGMDPKDTVAQAREMQAHRLSGPGGKGAVVLTGGRPEQVARALGYRYVYDAEHDQYAHDTTVFVLTPDGRVSRVLSEFALDGPTLGAALQTARKGRIGLLSEPLRLICYCLQPLTGAYDGPVVLALRLGGLFMVLAMVATVIVWFRRKAAP